MLGPAAFEELSTATFSCESSGWDDFFQQHHAFFSLVERERKLDFMMIPAVMLHAFGANYKNEREKNALCCRL
jgi:hypothetical protein